MEAVVEVIGFEPVWEELATTAQVRLLFLDELDGGALLDTRVPWLSADERARHDALSTERLRRDYVAGVALCRRSLSNCAPVDPAEWRFASNASGKPQIVAPAPYRSLKFSIARTKGLAACVVTRAGTAGVDVENTSRPVAVDSIARHFLTESERKRLFALPDAARATALYKMWVLHEAYVKATGKGLLGSKERIGIRLGFGDAPLPIANWALAFHTPSREHVAAVAIRQRRGVPAVSVSWSTFRLSL